MSSKRNKLPSTILFKNEEDESYFNSLSEWSAKIVHVCCPNCQLSFRKRKSSIYQNGHSYCRECSMHLTRLIDITGNRYGNVVVTGFSHTDRKSSYWNVLCDCGNTHVAEKQNLKRGQVKSCGCATKNNGCVLFGEDHPNWNPNLTDSDRLARRDLTENIHWRNDVYERDGYKCQICNKNEKLNAHHIYPYSTHKNLRFNIMNGITLCVSHHKEFHKLHGKNTGVAEDFLDYMNGRYYKSLGDLYQL